MAVSVYFWLTLTSCKNKGLSWDSRACQQVPNRAQKGGFPQVQERATASAPAIDQSAKAACTPLGRDGGNHRCYVVDKIVFAREISTIKGGKHRKAGLMEGHVDADGMPETDQ